MKRIKTVDRQVVLHQMMELATQAANDAVKLAYLTEENQADIESLKLGCLTEFKRSGNGTVEVKLTDRAAVLEQILNQLKDEHNAGPAAFLQALDHLPQAADPGETPQR